jgi:hypothetical protein
MTPVCCAMILICNEGPNSSKENQPVPTSRSAGSGSSHGQAKSGLIDSHRGRKASRSLVRRRLRGVMPGLGFKRPMLRARLAWRIRHH